MNNRETITGSVALSHLGLIRASGEDAVKFLQGQLTNDVTQLSDRQARLAGFCSAKGRMQANFLIWKIAPDELLLACAASVLATTLKRLSMFVLRARCKLVDATADISLHGAVGEAASASAEGVAVWGVAAVPGGTLVRLPDVDGVTRCVLARRSGGDTGEVPGLSLDAWRRLEVRSGIPIIEAATADQFVPQMINYEIVGGVDFGKGCYPGQEVVARSHYRGTVKRRMFLFECDAPAAAASEVFYSGDPEQPAGMVVNAAPLSGGDGSLALVEVKLAAFEGGSLHLGAPGGAALRRVPLPYPVVSDAASVA